MVLTPSDRMNYENHQISVKILKLCISPENLIMLETYLLTYLQNEAHKVRITFRPTMERNHHGSHALWTKVRIN